MTGTQQSGPGGNPEFDTEGDKSAGGASKGRGRATANPGSNVPDDYVEEAGREPASTRRHPRPNEQDTSSQQGAAGEQGTDGQPGQEGAEETPTRPQQGTGDSAEAQERSAAGGDSGQRRRDTGTPGSSDQAEPDDDEVIFDENKAAK